MRLWMSNQLMALEYLLILPFNPGVPLCWFRPGVPPSHNVYSPRAPRFLKEACGLCVCCLVYSYYTPVVTLVAATASLLPPRLLLLSSPPNSPPPRRGSGGGDDGREK